MRKKGIVLVFAVLLRCNTHGGSGYGLPAASHTPSRFGKGRRLSGLRTLFELVVLRANGGNLKNATMEKKGALCKVGYETTVCLR